MIKLEPQSLGDRIVAMLLEQLLDGQLPPGRRLVEGELAEQLGVSRTPVREALGRLARDGLVELLPNRGAVVRQLGAEELRHIYQVREALESLAAELACAHVTDDDLARLDALTSAADPRAADFAKNCRAADQALHRLIAVRCGNPVLAGEILRFRDVVQLVRKRVGDVSDALAQELVEHREIIAALRGRNSAAARDAMARHIRASLEVALRHVLESSEPATSPAERRRASAKRPPAARKKSGAALILLTAGMWWSAAAQAAETKATPAKVDFVAEIQPLLAARCVACHGPEEQAGELRWDQRAAALKGGTSGPAYVPGKSEASLAIKLITGADADAVMPPEGERLTTQEIALLKTWIDQGADWPEGVEIATNAAAEARQRKHWSFQPLVRPQVPVIVESRFALRNPIDHFIVAKLKEKGLEPSPEAKPSVLARRLKFDLLGLPPTPEEVEAFVRACSQSPSLPVSRSEANLETRRLGDGEKAFEALVDHLLASPQFGERWARHWLDVVRFAESNGFETNLVRPNAWPFRDYVIQAFNEDKPYDRFVLEQIAGDQLGADAATGFIVAGPWDKVKSPDPVLTAQQRADELHDMVGTTGSVFLGLTVGCARCHNHKFDPVSQVDYYALKAVFAGVQHGERELHTIDTEQRRRESATAEARLGEVERELAKYGSLLRPAVSRLANEERFPPVETDTLRFTVTATNNGSEPCIDELEVFTAEAKPRNVALASLKTVPKASTSFPRSDKHKLEHINDGQYGNGRSWISGQKGEGSITLRFSEKVRIDRVVWSRDRAADGHYTDRLPTSYTIEVGTEPGKWKTVATGDDRLPYGVKSPETTIKPKSGLAAVEASRVAELSRERRTLEAQLAKLKQAPMVYAGKFVKPEEIYRFHRGDPMQKRESIAAGAPAKIGPSWRLAADAPEQERRLALARWIVDRRNPLTARVIVNRLWQNHFGRGLVDTPSDFGLNGARPSHPELLDWLAVELMEHGWSLKHIHRLIVTSATYRQSSELPSSSNAFSLDADNQYLWRYAPRRLEAEPLRDTVLAVAGNLDLRMGGPGFDLFEANDNYVKVYEPKHVFGPAERRRMIYQTKPRMQLDDVFGAFDCPDAGQPAPKRTRSTTPLQALNLLNSPFLLEQAEVFAKRVEREAGPSVEARVTQAFRLAFGREPASDELRSAALLVKQYGLPALCRALYNANEFLYVF